MGVVLVLFYLYQRVYNTRMALVKAGDVFGRWTVQEDQKFNFVYEVMCKCACGTKRKVRASALVSERSQSCGCLRMEKTAERAGRSRKHIINVGDRFGRLTVVDVTSHKHVECICDCGATAKPSAANLYKGSTRSCGCLRMEGIRALGKANATRGGITEHTLYRTWERFTADSRPMHEPWRNDAALFIKDVEAELGERPHGLWLAAKDPELPLAPGNICWRKRSIVNPNYVFLTVEQKKEAAELVRAGCTRQEVADAFGVSRYSIYKIMKDDSFK